MALPTFLGGQRVRASQLQLLSNALAEMQDHDDDDYWSASTSDLAMANTNETSVVLSDSYTFKAGRAYAVQVGARWTTSGTTNTIRVRFYSAGSLLVDLGGVGPSQGGNTFGDTLANIVVNSGGSDLTRTVGVTTQMSSGTGSWNGGSSYPRYLWIRDVGAASKFADAVAVV